MEKKLQKVVCGLLALVLLFAAVPIGALVAVAAPSVAVTDDGQSPLKVEITSDKEKYTLLGKMVFTATITNVSDSTVEDISAVALFGASLRPLENGSQLTATRESLAPGAGFSFTYYADLGGLKSLDNLLLPLFWLSSWLHGGKADIVGGGGSGYIEASKTVGLVSLFSGLYDVSTAVRVYYEGFQPPIDPPVDPPIDIGDDQFRFTSFKADTYDVLVGEQTKVTFTATVETALALSDSDIRVYNANTDKFIAYLQNKGEGTFTGTVGISNSTRENVDFQARYVNIKSETFRVFFYENITDQQFDDFGILLNQIEGIRDTYRSESEQFILDKVEVHLKNSPIVESYVRSEASITFITKSGFHSIFNFPYDSTFKGSQNIKPSDSYKSANISPTNLSFNAPTLSKKNIVVLQPYFGFDPNFGDGYMTQANLLNSSIKGTVNRFTGLNADYERFKQLGDYDLILIDSHGGLDESTDTSGVCLAENYSKKIHSADYQAGRIYVHTNSTIWLMPTYFVRYYQKNELAGAFVYMGICWGAWNNRLAAGFHIAGAKTVLELVLIAKI